MATVIAGISGSIGSSLARLALAQHPDQPLIGLCRNPDAVPASLRSHRNLTLVPWDAGQSPSPSLARQVQEAATESGQIDTLIYSAGLLHDQHMFPEKRLEELQAQTMARSFQVNCMGFGLLVQALMPQLRGQRLTRVAAISAKVGSISDNRFGGWYAYRCSKAALNMMVKTLSIELTRRAAPATCVALHPGTTESPLSAPFGQSLDRLTVHTPDDTAGNLYRILEQLDETNNGRFISWDGTELPW